MHDRPKAHQPKSRRRPRVFNTRQQILPGSTPGTLVIDPNAPPPRITVMAFDEHGCEEARLGTVAEVASWRRKRAVVWIHVDGLGDAAVLQALADLVGIHGLVLEDVVHAHQRPKVEEYGEQLFIVARTATALGHQAEQLSLLVAPDLVVSFLERASDSFELVRQRIRDGKGRIRSKGGDYLAYALLDVITDDYFPLLDRFGDQLDALEEAATSRPERDTIRKIHEGKHDILLLQRVLWSTREMLNHLVREDTPVVSDETRVYLRDCHDHTIQLLDVVETYREALFGLTDVYLSTASHKMNEVMKVLTVIATVFIPLTFIAGVYGMNFATDKSPWNMPELDWYLGYPACLALMVATAAGFVTYLRRQGWIGSAAKRAGGPTAARQPAVPS